MPDYDFDFSNHGTVTLLRPLTDSAREWLDENIGDDALWLGDALAIEPRYAGDILEGIEDDGLTVG